MHIGKGVFMNSFYIAEPIIEGLFQATILAMLWAFKPKMISGQDNFNLQITKITKDEEYWV